MENYAEIVQFIRSLYQSDKEFIPLHAPVFKGNEKKYINDCIDSTFVSSVGKYVGHFEQLMTEFTGAKYAIAAVNGTAALHIALKLAGVGANDLVITQPLTFVATANAIKYCGAEPVFLDVDKDTLGLSPKALEHYLTKHCVIKKETCFDKTTQQRIKACVPMHTFGHPCRIDEIKKICDRFHVALIEDAAESLGSYYKGKHTGTFGLMGILSFNGNKTITTGGGGMLITNNEALAKRAKHLTTTAKMPHEWEFYHDELGYNYRLTNLAAALGCAQMEQLPGFLKSKKDIAQKYAAFFSTKGIRFITEPGNATSNYWLNAIILNSKAERDKFLTFTNSQGIMTRPIWQLMNRLPAFKSCKTDDLENALWLEERVVNIPSSVL
ncbi:MAG: LegC family aminotransferase [Salinivirgaceae bacterium]